MALNKYLDIHPEVAAALAAGKPVVALESTIISHGMPYPQNVETALAVEKIIRENGAVPATIAIIGGRLKAGLSAEEIEYFGKKGQAIHKASRRDLAVLCARGEDGATTVATTMIIAHMAGIKIFATGGIGGVHRGAETTTDISADLEELGQTPVMVVCAGAKSILDLGLTLEYLETKGVPVIGYGTDELPAFYTRQSGFGVDYRIDTPEELAAALKASNEMGMNAGMLVTNPIPEEFAMPKEIIDKAIDQAIAECEEQGIHGKATTPFLLARVAELTGGDSLASNIRLVFNNAKVAAQTAVCYAALGQKKFFLSPTASVSGDVTLGENVNIWHGAVLRGDNGAISIGDGTNIQDNCVVHDNTVIGKNCTVGHSAIVHGCTIGDNCMVGMGAIVLSGAKIGSNCLIGAGAVVTGKMDAPDGSMILGSPAKVVKEVSPEMLAEIAKDAALYIDLAKAQL